VSVGLFLIPHRAHLEDRYLHDSNILKIILDKLGVGTVTRFTRLKTGPRERLLCICIKILGSTKVGKISI
jgi:hypothetical protein